MLAASNARKHSEVRSSTKLENGFPRKATHGSVGELHPIDGQTTSEGTHQIQLKESLRKVRNARNILSKKASVNFNVSSFDVQSEHEASGEYELSHHDQLGNSKTSSLRPANLMQA